MPRSGAVYRRAALLKGFAENGYFYSVMRATQYLHICDDNGDEMMINYTRIMINYIDILLYGINGVKY